MIGNPQTDRFLETLCLDHRITVPFTGGIEQQPPPFFRQRPPQQLVPTSVIHGRSINNMPSHGMGDDNEIDLDDDQDETEGSAKQLVPSAVIRGRSNDNMPRQGMDDDNEIDLDDDQDETEGSSKEASNGFQGMVGKNTDDSCLDTTQDPSEIDLEESENEDENAVAIEDDAGGDDVCFSPPGSVAKKPRTEC